MTDPERWIPLPDEEARPDTWEVQQEEAPFLRIAHVYGESSDEAERLATLLAAAPDLLEAAENALRVFGGVKLRLPNPTEKESDEFNAVLQLSAAVAQATGKDSA